MDLRCYGLTTLRHDGKISVHLQDLDHFYYEWDIDSLPWESVTPVPPGQEHPEVLDQRLIGALSEVVPKGIDEQSKALRGAVLTFLYLYMILCRHDDRLVYSTHHHVSAGPVPSLPFVGLQANSFAFPDLPSISQRDHHSR